jgi:hypothetical protein
MKQIRPLMIIKHIYANHMEKVKMINLIPSNYELVITTGNAVSASVTSD